MMLIVQCLICSKSFSALRKSRKYCSDSCNNRAFRKRHFPEWVKKGIILNCGVCKKEIYLPPSKSSQKKTFCKEHKNGDKFSFPCKVCGTKVFTQPAQLKYRARSTCSKICRRKLAHQRAEVRHQYVTQGQLNRFARYSVEAFEWRKSVFKRDDYTCQMCFVRGKYLEADHIKPWAYFPELRFELTNGRTLCRPCHNTTKISAKKMRQIYGKS